MNWYSDFKKISISSYLQDRGLEVKGKRGSKTFFSSPFSEDSTPSFVVYEGTNTFYDFSVSGGFGGDILSLVQKLEGCSFMEAIEHLAKGSLLPVTFDIKLKKEKKKEFEYERFITNNPIHKKQIDAYAKDRKIYDHYKHGVFYEKIDGQYRAFPSLMFLHQDKDRRVIGAKFRHASSSLKKFSARGSMGLYVLDNCNSDEDAHLFLVESETSANSLYTSLNHHMNFVVISFGSVGTKIALEDIPEEFKDIKNKYIIIDYDGNERLYQERIRAYSNIAQPLKLIAGKGDDLNQIHQDKNEVFIRELIFNLLKNKHAIYTK